MEKRTRAQRQWREVAEGAEAKGSRVVIEQAVPDTARRSGLLTRPGADWVGVAPPLCTTREEADEIVTILETAVSDVVA